MIRNRRISDGMDAIVIVRNSPVPIFVCEGPVLEVSN